MDSTESDEMRSMKVKLSTLWIFLTLNYIYADVVGLFNPDTIKNLLTGSIQMTQGLLLGSAVLVELPMVMIVMSRFLKYRANRWANIIAGIVSGGINLATFFVGTPTLYYIFFGVIETVCFVLIVWYAWKWRN